MMVIIMKSIKYCIRCKLLALLLLLTLAIGSFSACLPPTDGSDGTEDGGGTALPPEGGEGTEDGGEGTEDGADGGTNAECDPTKESILAKIECSEGTPEEGFEYVGQYYFLWTLPEFDHEKMLWAESVFIQAFNLDCGLPPVHEHARLAALKFLDEHYESVDLSDKAAVTDALITCYVEVVGDPYSIYRTPESYDDYQTDMSGKFGGIGVSVKYNHDDETIIVSTVSPGAPAEAAGFAVGDLIYAVDGVTVEEIGYLNAVNVIRGEIGTEVTITVRRGGELIDLVATRALVTELSIQYEITEEGYGYITIAGFKSNTFSQFAAAIEEMKAKEVEGIIFDLRSNPGGYLSAVRDMISYIVPNGLPIVSYELKDGKKVEIFSKADKVDPNAAEGTGEKTVDSVLEVPIVVICNEYTASAGEIFTAAVRDYRNDGILSATIVGVTTYKKGIMQNTYLYSEDGSSITVTTAYYNPPSGVNYHGVGVTPDVTVDITEGGDAQYDAAVVELEKLLESK